MNDVLGWAEEHPWLAGGLTLGVVFLLLWLLGFFSSSSSANTGTNNLAAAYYAAEAAQTTAATQLQMATVAYGNQTAQAQIQATAAEAIASTSANMQTTLGQQSSNTQITLGQQGYNAAVELGQQQLTATEYQSNDALQATVNAQNNAGATAQAGYAAQELSTVSGLIPSEFTQSPATGNVGFYIGGLGTGQLQLQQTSSPVGGPVDPATVAQWQAGIA